MSEYDCSQSQHNQSEADKQGPLDNSAQKARSASVGGRNSSQGREEVNAAGSAVMSERNEDFECLSQHGISAETFNLIQTKERFEDQAKQRNIEVLEKATYKRELQEHLKVAEAMRCIILERQSKVLPLLELIELLQERIFGQFIESVEMKRVIASICRILPNWCRLI